MNNSADIRSQNMKSIYRFMLDGKQHTKQQVSNGTGLSVATCNTLLNHMLSKGIISGDSKLPNEVGRSSVLYQINKDHEHYLAMDFFVEQGNKMVETIVFSATGDMILQEKKQYEFVDYTLLEAKISALLRADQKITQIIIGTPSIADNGTIKHCDIPELEGVPMKSNLEQGFGLKASIENDMHHKAYGFCKSTHNEDKVITLAYFPRHILPGTVTIHKGTIIKGANNFAGMTGFLPFDVSRKEQLSMLKKESCIPFISKSLSAIIVLLNPSHIVLTGDLIDETICKEIKEECIAGIPKEYLPEFSIVSNFDKFYYTGMYQLAVDNKKI